MKIRNVIMCVMLAVVTVPPLHASEARQNREQCCSLKNVVGIGFVCVGLLIGLDQQLGHEHQKEIIEWRKEMDNIYICLRQCDIRKDVLLVCEYQTPSKCRSAVEKNAPLLAGLVRLKYPCNCSRWCSVTIEARQVCSRLGHPTCDPTELKWREVNLSQCAFLGGKKIDERYQSAVTFFNNNCNGYGGKTLKNNTIKNRGMCHQNKNNALSRQNRVCKLAQQKNNKFSKGKR